MRRQRGFTLIEVVIAVAILGISLTVLLQSQAASLASAGRSRDLTVATLLARGKMIDIEKHLFHDGFQFNTEDEEGDFNDEGHPDVKWHYRISEVELDISALTSICGGLAGQGGKKGGKKSSSSSSSSSDTASSDCESMLGGVGTALGSFTDEIGRSLRVADLKITWSEGKYKQSLNVRALLSRDDFQTEQENDMQKALNQATGGQGLPGVTAPTTAAPTTAPGILH